MTRRSISRLTSVTLLTVPLLVGAPRPAAAGEGFYNIAHMVNTTNTVDWALGRGANAVEMDLRFDAAGNPTEFRHGGACDCSCYCGANTCATSYPSSNCAQLENDQAWTKRVCDASTPALTMFQHLATKAGLALVFLDSKVESGDYSGKLADAGKNLVPYLETNLFGRGYRGKVVISAPTLAQLDYVTAAATAAKTSTNGSRMFFTVDGETDFNRDTGNVAADTITKLTGLASTNRVYGTGISACSPRTFHNGIRVAAANQAAGVLGLVYIWTIDKQSSMQGYIDDGARGIMSNFPGDVAALFYQLGLPLATPDSVIPTATSSTVLSSVGSCDCDYHPGGCSISRAAPANLACQCSYKGAWTCGGSVVGCRNPDAASCRTPDLSVASCVQGGGDCDGYKQASCDCDYHPGGCSISKAAPANTACQCSYKGAWTCGGSVVKCLNFDSPYCQTPDTTVNSCAQGGGDCDGYKQASCDCDYHPGGCSISKAAPANTACQCKYKGAWTCSGSIVRCKDPNSAACTRPDTSLASCFQGSGDCQGYGNATCDCNYHSGGCSISKVAPTGSACHCTYKGAWTCGGHVVACADPNAPLCFTPNASKAACILGGGDCGGY